MEELGYIKDERCNRNGCFGVLYRKEQDGECSCHRGNPPCGYCVESIGCCPECGWNEIDSMGTREVLIEKSTFFIELRIPTHSCDFRIVKAMECAPEDVDEGTINAIINLSPEEYINREEIYKNFYKIYEPSLGFNWAIISKRLTKKVKRKQ
jgi:hypothetical protein